MQTQKYYLLFSAFAFFVLLFSGCGAAEPVAAEVRPEGICPPGSEPVKQGYQFPNMTPPPETVSMPITGKCPPGYYAVQQYTDWGDYDYCHLDPPVSVPLPSDGKCPSGYHLVCPPPGDPRGVYCLIDPTPTPTMQASNSGIPDLKPAIEVVQYCANKGANLGGVNISYPVEDALHIEDWFSERPGHVKCVDDVSNPRICWGPQSTTFDVLLCNGNLAQNQDRSDCETLPVTLGACAQKRESDNEPEPAPTSCRHC